MKVSHPSSKYRRLHAIDLPDRRWPDQTIDRPPQWCSVDLRDGNQALAVPMNVSQKLEMFDALVACGFKQIEVGFPAAAPTEFHFLRTLIEQNRIPADVWVQVLVQAREDLIERTIEALVGAERVIIHLYNSTSPAQRRIVFGLDKSEIKDIAVRGVGWIRERLSRLGDAEVMLEYSPESFSATETDYALEICESVIDEWEPTPEKKIILNLPDTVEVAMPNVYADQIEWFIRHLRRRDSAIISLHTHNDRGTGTAKTELGLLAGADRVEGTLFGNGERTGNLDIITVAMNLHMHGIDPGLDFSDINHLIDVYERCTGMTIPPRQPYAGELVFTAFSGSHQDAIKKGLSAWQEAPAEAVWDIPYLTIDPSDLGRQYREVIRVNSQSGKGGVAYLLESEFGILLPKEMQREFGPLANEEVDRLGREVTGTELKAMFWKEYIDREEPWRLVRFDTTSSDGVVTCQATIRHEGAESKAEGQGNGPIAAFSQALRKAGAPAFSIEGYHEHALSGGSEANAIAYIRIRLEDGRTRFGAAVDPNIELASIRAVLSALNRAHS